VFGINLICRIKSVKVSVKLVSGLAMRRCAVVLTHVFDESIASELGQEGVDVRAGLMSHGIEKAVLPIGGMRAAGAFQANGESVSINHMFGVKVTGTAGKKEDQPPVIDFEFDFPWNADAWAFLGRHCSSEADIVLHKSVGEMEVSSADQH
jgi:hypothetical protein